MSESVAWHRGSTEAFIREAEKIRSEAQVLPARAEAYASLLEDFVALQAEVARLRLVVAAADFLREQAGRGDYMKGSRIHMGIERYDTARAALDEAGKENG